jgi:hypothetical protein
MELEILLQVSHEGGHIMLDGKIMFIVGNLTEEILDSVLRQVTAQIEELKWVIAEPESKH